MLRLLVVIGVFFASAVSAQQAGWPDLNRLLFPPLTRSGTAEAANWLPDHPDPAQATQGLGVVYEYIAGSAGSVSIAVGYFQRVQGGWVFVRAVEGLFGQEPRDPLFHNGMMDVTTTVPGPNDPRCCPTQVARWRIDLANGKTVRLQ